jgi:polysaccharide export outer membrane protein
MVDLKFSGRLKLALAIAMLPALLGACALAPGMRLDPKAPVDSSDPASTPDIATITPQLVRQQKAERDATSQGDYRQLIGYPSHYVIGPADVLSIIVWDHPELVVPNLTYSIGDTAGTLPNGPGLSTQTVPGFVVGDNGDIQFPYVGKVKASGGTVAQLQATLKRLLTPYLRNPQLTVSVVAYRSQRVFVEGQVNQPGIKPITNVPMSLSEALSEANGVTAGVGDTSRIQILRNGRTFQISLPQLAEQKLDASMIFLKDRDVVRVLPQTYNQVFVTGEVMRPMTLSMHDGRLTLNDALASAAGVNPSTAEAAGVYVVRPTEDPAAPQVFHLDSTSPVALALAEHFELQPKDVVYVDATGLARWNRIVNLLLPSAQGANIGRQVAGY